MPTISPIVALFLLPAAISAVTFDCKAVQVDKAKFNFETLGGPKDVHFQHWEPPSISNITYTIDICKPLVKDKNIDSKLQCPGGTRVCGIERDYNDANKEPFTKEVIPIAGEYTFSDGRHLDPKFTRIKDSASSEDADAEGVIGELYGGMWGKQKQKAIIRFECDRDWEGTEGLTTDAKMMDYGRMSRRADGDEEKDPDADKPELPDLDKGKALQYVSYKTEKDDVGVLRLKWKTRFACEGEAAKQPAKGDGSKGWGFFTWLLIIVFLVVASYIIFGSWLNYNRYGARGWDLIPHGDAIRDVPYIVKDWTTSMTDRMRNGGNRGGYSAV